MTGRVIFMLEEPSMKILLDGFLPRLVPGWLEGEHFLCIKHDGKSDLDLSITRKLQAWKTKGDRFVIVRDNDNADCVHIKARLRALCKGTSYPDTLIRLVCQELESWYVGDLQSLALAFGDPKLDSPALRKRFSVPDDWQKPSAELSRLIPTFQKGSGARAMSAHLRGVNNRSKSFQVFVEGVQRIATEMPCE